MLNFLKVENSSDFMQLLFCLIVLIGIHSVRLYHGILKRKFVFVGFFHLMHLFLFVLYECKSTFCEIASVSHRGVLLATEITEEQITIQGEYLRHCA